MRSVPRHTLLPVVPQAHSIDISTISQDVPNEKETTIGVESVDENTSERKEVVNERARDPDAWMDERIDKVTECVYEKLERVETMGMGNETTAKEGQDECYLQCDEEDGNTRSERSRLSRMPTFLLFQS
jgi:hypothetical protein